MSATGRLRCLAVIVQSADCREGGGEDLTSLILGRLKASTKSFDLTRRASFIPSVTYCPQAAALKTLFPSGF